MTLRVNHRVIHANSLNEAYFKNALEQLPMSWKPEILKYVHLADKVRSLEPRILLLEQLKAMGIPKDNYAEMYLTDYKKPYFPDLPNIHFSLAHSNMVVICAICDSGRVGVDVEYIKPVNFDSLRSSLNELEWKDVKAAHSPVKRFYEIWTMKEAILKADGRGMYAPLKMMKLLKSYARLEEDFWYLNRIEMGDQYCGYIACEKYNSEPIAE